MRATASVLGLGLALDVGEGKECRLRMRAWYWDGVPQRAFGGSGG
jgi:hypothetical protein